MRLAPREICSGCAACHDVCAVGAIALEPDAEGFLYPVVNPLKCVSCGKCTRVCPALNPSAGRRPLAIWAARAAEDPKMLADSSSGGIFTLLARNVLSAGGVVFGATWSEDWTVEHGEALDEAGLSRMRGSKYLQSRLQGTYARVMDVLKTGRPVLFSGTPCQAAALRRFLGKDYEKLLIVEVICHAVPSPTVWKAFLRQFPGEPVGVFLRDKSLGWPHSVTRIDYADGTSRKIERNSFTLAFAYELCNRPSCHRCRMRGLSSGADLTMGDFNGIGRCHPEFDDGCGVSCVLALTVRGRQAFDRIRSACECVSSRYEEILTGNPSLERSFPAHALRNEFMRQCLHRPFDETVKRFLSAHGLVRWALRLRQFFNDLRRK